MKFKPILLLLFFLLCMPIQMLAQEDITAATIEQLEKEMYRLYPTRNVDEFMDATERLKEAALKAGEEGLFYRAWANQASFNFTKIDRQKGMDIAKAMNEYSKQHDSKLGIYYSSLTNANQASSLKMEEDALKLYLNAIEYKQKYLPNVNASPAYIGAAKVYHNRQQKDKLLEMTDKALAEPNLIASNIVDAWSYRCMAAMMPKGVDHKEEFNRAYEEWKKAKEKYNYNSAFTNLIEIYHAQVNNDYDKMLELAKDIKSPQERYNMMAHAYEYLLEDDILYFCLGDVSGKGVPASLFMAQAIRLFRALAKQHQMPAYIATRLNEELTEKNDNGMFVTMFIGQLNLITGLFHFCNAGHNPPVIGGDEQHGSFLEMESNAPIGLWPGLEFIGEEIESIKGRPLFIYSDGLNEAENMKQEQFGDDRMLDILRHTKFNDARHVVEQMETEVKRHRNGAEPNDDMTIMCIKA